MYANPIQVCWTPNIRSASVTKEKEYGRLSCLVWLQTLSQILVLWLFVAFWDFVCQLFLFMLSAIFIILTFLQPLLVSHILNDCYNIYVKELNLVPGSNLLASRCVPSGFTAPCFTCGSRLFYYPPVLYLPAGKSLPSRFPEGGDFAPLGPQDCPRASPSGYLAVLGGCISQYIPPLGSVRIQHFHCKKNQIGPTKYTQHWKWPIFQNFEQRPRVHSFGFIFHPLTNMSYDPRLREILWSSWIWNPIHPSGPLRATHAVHTCHATNKQAQQPNKLRMQSKFQEIVTNNRAKMHSDNYTGNSWQKNKQSNATTHSKICQCIFSRFNLSLIYL